MAVDIKDESGIEAEVLNLLAEQNELAIQEQALFSNPEFTAFIDRQKEVNAKLASFWKELESKMIEAGLKSVKGKWGYVTIADRTDYKVADIELLPPKFIKKVADTDKIKNYYKLEGKLPKGVEMKHSQHLTKRIKSQEEIENGK